MIKLLLVLCGVFASMSLIAVGGGTSILPELHLRAVEQFKWMTDEQFVNIFAITQATPGPGMLIVTMIGYKAGLPYGVGFAVIAGLVATAMMFLPPCALAYTASRLYEKLLNAPWHVIAQKGASSVTLGLLFAAALIVTRGSDHSHSGYVVTAITAVVVAFTRISPVILMIIAGILGGFGLIK